MSLDKWPVVLANVGVIVANVGVLILALNGFDILRRLRKIEDTLTELLRMLADHDNRLAAGRKAMTRGVKRPVTADELLTIATKLTSPPKIDAGPVFRRAVKIIKQRKLTHEGLVLLMIIEWHIQSTQCLNTEGAFLDASDLLPKNGRAA